MLSILCFIFGHSVVNTTGYYRGNAIGFHGDYQCSRCNKWLKEEQR